MVQHNKMQQKAYPPLTCVAFFHITQTLLLTISALIGFDLATDKQLATLPMALLFLSIALTTIPASWLIHRLGQTLPYILASVMGIIASVITLWSLFNSSFFGFCVASICFGVYAAFNNDYRSTTADVAPELKSRVTTLVLIGGFIAAFIGPNLSNWGAGIFDENSFAGAFLLLVGIYLLNITTVLLAQLTAAVKPINQHVQNNKPARTTKEIIRQPVFIIAIGCQMLGFTVLNLILISTPLAMNTNAMTLGIIALVIQIHFVAMFASSFLTTHFLRHFGLVNILLAGVVFGILCIAVNISGDSQWHFISALFLLGISWNCFLFGGNELLAKSYEANEKTTAQNAGTIMVASAAAVITLLAGMINYKFGWQAVNIAALPILLMICTAIIWLYRINVKASTTRMKPKSTNQYMEGVREFEPPNLQESERCISCRGRSRIKTGHHWTMCKRCNGSGVQLKNKKPSRSKATVYKNNALS